jgi:UDP-N-acetylmuramate dehydrogenase
MSKFHIRLAFVRQNVALSDFSWWRIGGLADLFAEPRSEFELVSLLKDLKQYEIPYCFIGRGTNLLFDDAGFRGCVIRLGPGFCETALRGNQLTVGAAAWTPLVALRAARSGVSGIEHTIGIPASFGGLICMNGGSQRKGVGDITERVRALALSGEIVEHNRNDCDFSYRNSRFQDTGEIVLSATLRFQHRRPYPEQRRELLGILRERSLKFPRKLPSCGSVFKSSPALYEAYGPPGKIIEDLGLKRLMRGRIQVSPQHANFIVNCGGGSSADVLALVSDIREKVLEKTGLLMEPEFKHVHPVHGIRSI